MRNTKILNHFYTSWIQPFKNPVFGRFCQANFLHSFGGAFLGLTYIFDLSGYGLLEVLCFFLLELGLLGLLIMPLAFWSYQHINKKPWRNIITGLTILPVIAMPFTGDSILLKGSLLSLSSSTFWILYHIFMTNNSTVDNKGNDVSVALNSVAFGGLCGTGAATLISLSSIPLIYLGFIGSMLCMIGTLLLLKYELKTATNFSQDKYKDPDHTVLSVIFEKPKRSINTILYGLMEIPTAFVWALWLIKIGLTFVAVGSLYIVSTLMKFALSGCIGWIANKKPGTDLQIGAGLYSLGWLPWLFTLSITNIPFTILLWGLGGHFRAVGITSQWYDCKSIPCLSAHEICLAIGRIIGIFMCVPLLFIAPKVFAIVGFAISIAICIYNHRFSRSTQHQTRPQI